MKTIVVVISLGAAIAGALLSGCSKSKDPGPQSEKSPASTPASAATGDSAEMRIKWPVGKKYSLRMELNQTYEMNSQPEQQVNMTQEFDIGSLKELGNGRQQLELEFKGQTMEVNQGGRQVFGFDSAKSSMQDTNPIVPLLRKMVGARIRYLTAADGTVEKVEGVEELMNRIGFNRKSQQHAMFKQMVSEETLKQYGSFGETMPNRMVKVGESWKVKKDVVTGAGSITTDIKYTFNNWEQYDERKCARIKVQGDISPAPGPAAPNTTIKIEKGKLSGDLWFDPDLGMIVGQNFNQNMTLKIAAGGQTLTPELKQKIRITLVDVKTAH